MPGVVEWPVGAARFQYSRRGAAAGFVHLGAERMFNGVAGGVAVLSVQRCPGQLLADRGNEVLVVIPGVDDRQGEPGGGRGGVDRYSDERSDLAEHITALTEIVTRLQAARRVTTLGINYAAYLRFRSLIPAVEDMFEGRCDYYASKSYAPDER
ncbi:hypothetical protein [Micromonospora aurantiaca (nom. illeg.)]|uniref:hypothetical protein n=1 Tax=Micromonospora aurantiaca (nom. illeg.) TaxID=47850 RepID=UPI0008283B2A|nr:hypothetical protein [Micromonospora aurantiaca]SCL35804.1 hypothetical protein GA0070615_2890 [Micromonospora aurantiaca]